MCLAKRAYDEVAANKVLQAAKKIQAPKKLLKVVSPPVDIPGAPAHVNKMLSAASRHNYAAVPNAGAMLSASTGKLRTAGFKGQSLGGAVRSVKKEIKDLRGGLRMRSKDRRIFAPERGDAVSNLSKLTKATGTGKIKTKLTQPHERKMFDSIIKGHELDETSIRKHNAHHVWSHMSPDVVLREHNRVTTLPKKYENVKRVAQELRHKQEGPSLEAMVPGFRYGDSPRLSRHARKRVSEIVKNETTSAAPNPELIRRSFAKADEWSKRFA